MKIVACQTPHLDIGEKDKILELFRKSINSDIICFPENFLQHEVTPKNYQSSVVAEAKKFFSFSARKFGKYVAMGSVTEKVNGSFYNRAYLIGKDGRIIGHYDKINIDRTESWKSAGKKARVFKTGIGSIGLLICRDLLYPECSASIAKQGADLIIMPAFWCSYNSRYPKSYTKMFYNGKEPREVDSLVAARAIENGIAFAFVNGAEGNKERKLLGRTQIAVPFYGTIARIDGNESKILKAKIDISLVQQAKKAYGFG